jgi:excinuclease UvrABC nuclease subunit
MYHESFDLPEFRRDPIPTRSACRGVYFLFQAERLQYVGRSWNCKLRASEHARQERIPHTDWRMIPVDDEADCAELESTFIRKLGPPYNRG